MEGERGAFGDPRTRGTTWQEGVFLRYTPGISQSQPMWIHFSPFMVGLRVSSFSSGRHPAWQESTDKGDSIMTGSLGQALLVSEGPRLPPTFRHQEDQAGGNPSGPRQYQEDQWIPSFYNYRMKALKSNCHWSRICMLTLNKAAAALERLSRPRSLLPKRQNAYLQWKYTSCYEPRKHLRQSHMPPWRGSTVELPGRGPLQSAPESHRKFSWNKWTNHREEIEVLKKSPMER